MAENGTIVTGAGSGIGAAVARRLAARNDAVILGDVDLSAVERLAAELRADGRQALALQVDMTDPQSVERFVTEAAAFAPLSSAVACAGIAAQGLVTEMPVETFDRIMAVNVRGVFLLAKYVIPALLPAKGSFVVIGSGASLAGAQEHSAYCASKHAVAGLVKCLALDHGRDGLRSNAICPGPVETPMMTRFLSEQPGSRAQYEQDIPLARFAKPEDVASLADFLTSDAGAYISGALIPIDGGGCAGRYHAPPTATE